MNKTRRAAPVRIGDFNLPTQISACMALSVFFFSFFARCCLSVPLPARRLVAGTLSVAACLCIRWESDRGRLYPADKETLLITDVVSTKSRGAGTAAAAS